MIMNARDRRPPRGAQGAEEHVLVDFVSKMNREPIDQLRAKLVTPREASLITGHITSNMLWLYVPGMHEDAIRRLLVEEEIPFRRSIRVSPGTPRAFSIAESHKVQDLFHQIKDYFEKVHPEAHVIDHSEHHKRH